MIASEVERKKWMQGMRENSLQGVQVSIERLHDTVTWMLAQLEMVELQVYIFFVWGAAQPTLPQLQKMGG